MPRLKTKTVEPSPRKYSRRSEADRIADLEAKIQALKDRAATKAVTRDPAYRYVSKAIKAIDGAASATGDQAMRGALEEVRATLSACMQLKGVVVPQGRRDNGVAVEPDAVLAYVQKNPGQRGEQIAAGLGTDSKAMRPAMKQLIEGGQVKTKGERRGMQYWVV